MKAILIFNLPDDQEDYELANQANNMYNVLFEFQEWLLRRYHYNSPPNKYIEQEYEEIKQYFFDLLKGHQIEL